MTPLLSGWTPEEDRLGFFGPDSVSWRVHSDPSFSVGGLRALLLQALHPVAMDGVARFSGGFKEEPWPRLIRTATYVDTLTFGTRTEAVRAVARVRGIHRRLGATEEGTLRRHMVTESGRVRDTVYFSVIEPEWPEVSARLQAMMEQHG